MSLPGFTASNSVYSSSEMYKNLIIYRAYGYNVQTMARAGQHTAGWMIVGMTIGGLGGGLGGAGVGAFIGAAVGALMDLLDWLFG